MLRRAAQVKPRRRPYLLAGTLQLQPAGSLSRRRRHLGREDDDVQVGVSLLKDAGRFGTLNVAFFSIKQPVCGAHVTNWMSPEAGMTPVMAWSMGIPDRSQGVQIGGASVK